jgi:hypothetical protein
VTPSSFSPFPVAVPLPAGFKAVEVTAGRAHACARSSANTIVCWGASTKGQLGNGATAGFSAAPVAFALPLGALPITIAAGGDTTCLLTTNGTRLCVGDNTYNQMGIGGVGASSNPTPRMQLLAADKVLVGPPVPPTFLTLANGANTCSLKLVVEIGITCERAGPRHSTQAMGAGRRKGCRGRDDGKANALLLAPRGFGPAHLRAPP